MNKYVFILGVSMLLGLFFSYTTPHHPLVSFYSLIIVLLTAVIAITLGEVFFEVKHDR